MGAYMAVGECLKAIDEQPSIDIVKCKECKYYEAKEDWCYWRDEAITADDFCSYGERSDDGKDIQSTDER